MKKFLSVLTGKTISPPPIWLMRQAGRHLKEYKKLRQKAETFLSFCYSPELAAEATLQPIRRYDFDAAILFSDILVIPDALGQKVSFIEGKGPLLDPIETLKDIKHLSSQNLSTHLQPVYETVDRVTNQLPSKTALIGFSGAPWTTAAYMIEGGASKEFNKLKFWASGYYKDFQILIDCLVEAISAHLIYQVDAGCEAVQIFDTWAGLTQQEEFEKWVIEPTKKIVKTIKQRHPSIPIIGFPKGAGGNYKSFVLKTGVDAVSVDSDMSLKWVKENIQRYCVVQGNLDNLVLLEGGFHLDTNVEKIIKVLGENPFIFNLGHGVLPETPITHVERLIALVRNG